MSRAFDSGRCFLRAGSGETGKNPVKTLRPNWLILSVADDAKSFEVAYGPANPPPFKEAGALSGPAAKGLWVILIAYRMWARKFPNASFVCEGQKDRGPVAAFCDAIVKSNANWVRDIFAGDLGNLFADGGNWHGRNPRPHRRLQINSAVLPAENISIRYRGRFIQEARDEMGLAREILSGCPRWGIRTLDKAITTPFLFDTGMAAGKARAFGHRNRTGSKYLKPADLHETLDAPALPDNLMVEASAVPAPSRGVLQLTGQGGIGKTTLGSIIAREWLSRSKRHRLFWLDCRRIPNESSFYRLILGGDSGDAGSLAKRAERVLSDCIPLLVFDEDATEFPSVHILDLRNKFAEAYSVLLLKERTTENVAEFKCVPLSEEAAQLILLSGLKAAFDPETSPTQHDIDDYIRFMITFSERLPLNCQLAISLAKLLGTEAITNEAKIGLKTLSDARPPTDTRLRATSALVDLIFSKLKHEERELLLTVAMFHCGLPSNLLAKFSTRDAFYYVEGLKSIRFVEEFRGQITVQSTIRELILERLTPRQHEEQRNSILRRVQRLRQETNGVDFELLEFGLRQYRELLCI